MSNKNLKFPYSTQRNYCIFAYCAIDVVSIKHGVRASGHFMLRLVEVNNKKIHNSSSKIICDSMLKFPHRKKN